MYVLGFIANPILYHSKRTNTKKKKKKEKKRKGIIKKICTHKIRMHDYTSYQTLDKSL